MSGGNRFPFTASQWQELEHQALFFKYLISGIPIPPDLLISIKRSCFDSSRLFPRQPQHVGWNCFQMGLGRKVDPEPGRCRRTDGKKWRCSKEAYLDSKYCERHMHRGKHRSRKPVEVTPATAAPNPSTATVASIAKNHHPPSHQLPYPVSHSFLYPLTSRPTGISLSPQENSTHSLLDSGTFSRTNTDYRRNNYVYGVKDEVDEHAFFSEPSGTIRSFSGTSIEDSWQLTPLTMSSSSSASKQRTCDYSYLQLQGLQDQTPKQSKQEQQHFYAFGNEIKGRMGTKVEKNEETQKTVHRFFDEWPPTHRDSWLDLDDKSSNKASATTAARLSISIPSSSLDFPIFNSRTHNDG
ncbi:hypothetical protein SLEP1_g28361 [Rubroshorea leprosula]|uniref:Growth-regulating factor n=1 Tax=Rubroshorea leprosula TaxID=152421 RepID=A0AAV5JZJ4_9ROSI|nr:hypothetical protein SLEP1_g28361 [Rubroshorea leprosula]